VGRPPDRIFSVSPDGTAVRLNDDQPIAPLKPGDRLGELPNVGGIYNQPASATAAASTAPSQWKINPQLEASAQYLGTGYRARSAVDYILGIVTWTPRLTNVVLAPQGDYCNTPERHDLPDPVGPCRRRAVRRPYDWDPYTATSTWGVKEHTTTHYLNLGVQYKNGPWKASNFAWTKSTFVNDTVIVDQQIPGASIDVYTYGATATAAIQLGHHADQRQRAARPQPVRAARDGAELGHLAGEQSQWRSTAATASAATASSRSRRQRRAPVLAQAPASRARKGHSDISGTRARRSAPSVRPSKAWCRAWTASAAPGSRPRTTS
jgi:iron complex outermembrane receptor protein